MSSLFDGNLIDLDEDGKGLDYVDIDFTFDPNLRDMSPEDIKAIREKLKEAGIEFEGFDEE